MTYREARVYLDDMSKYGSVLGLDTVRALLGELGNPQDGLKFIHVAGTNGKGSILAYVSTILREAGFLVGRYVSPTVVSYLEKIQVDGRWIGEDEFAALVEKVQKAVACMETNGRGHPTVFEMETAMAFLYFREKKCDYVVLETGLGGRLDATNVVENTVLAIFSSIGRDHMGILGDTLTEIAGEKAGIMKPGCRVVSAAQKPEVRKALEERAAQLGCPITFARPENARVVEEDYKGMRFSYTLTDSQSPLARSASNAGCPEGYTLTDSQSPPAPQGHAFSDLRIRLAGKCQIENAVTAIEAAWVLRDMGDVACFSVQGMSAGKDSGTRGITEEAIRRGLEKTAWAGRFTCIGERPTFIVDGAHNVDAAVRLRRSMETYFPQKRLFYIIGVFKDKEYEKIVEIMAPLAARVYTVDLPNAGRTLSAKHLKETFDKELASCGVGTGTDARAFFDAEGGVGDDVFSGAGNGGVRVEAVEDIDRAVRLALAEAGVEDVILAFGSLSYLGRVMEIVKEKGWK